MRRALAESEGGEGDRTAPDLLGELGSPCSRWQCVEDVPADREGVSQSEECCRAAGISAFQGPPPHLSHAHHLLRPGLWGAAPSDRGMTRGRRSAMGFPWVTVCPPVSVAFSCPFAVGSHLFQKVGKGQEVTQKQVCLAWQRSCVSYLGNGALKAPILFPMQQKKTRVPSALAGP